MRRTREMIGHPPYADQVKRTKSLTLNSSYTLWKSNLNLPWTTLWIFRCACESVALRLGFEWRFRSREVKTALRLILVWHQSKRSYTVNYSATTSYDFLTAERKWFCICLSNLPTRYSCTLDTEMRLGALHMGRVKTDTQLKLHKPTMVIGYSLRMCARHVDSTNPGRSNLVCRSKPIPEAEMSNRLIPRCQIGLHEDWLNALLCWRLRNNSNSN